MKKTNRAARLVKPIIATLTASMSKAKACTSTIELLFSLLRRKKLLAITGSISRKLLPAQKRGGAGSSRDIVRYRADREGGPSWLRFRDWWPAGSGKAETAEEDEDDDDDGDEKFQFPDLTHPMFASPGFIELNEEEESIINGGSVMIQAFRSSRVESGEEFRLEDEIDQAVDSFIRRFYLQQRMQRQLSLKSK